MSPHVSKTAGGGARATGPEHGELVPEQDDWRNTDPLLRDACPDIIHRCVEDLLGIASNTWLCPIYGIYGDVEPSHAPIYGIYGAKPGFALRYASVLQELRLLGMSRLGSLKELRDP